MLLWLDGDVTEGNTITSEEKNWEIMKEEDMQKEGK